MPIRWLENGTGWATKRAVFIAAGFCLFYGLWLIFRVGGEEGLRYLSGVVYQFPPTVVTGVCAWAALRSSGRERAGWFAFTAGIGCWAAAEWVWSGYDLIFRAETPLFSAADPLYYLGYPFLMVGIALLVLPSGGSRSDTKSLLDGLLLATVLGVAGWAYLLIPIYQNTTASPLDVLVTLGYPILDVALLMTIVFTFYRVHGTLRLPALLLVAGALITTVADGIYVYLATVSGYDVYGNPLELGWIAAYFCFGIAAIARIEERERSGAATRALNSNRQRVIGVVLPYLGLTPLVIVHAYELANGTPNIPLSAGMIAATCLVVGRQFVVLQDLAASRRQLQRLNEQLQESMSVQHHLARADMLTGIPNRRYLDEALESECARASRYGQPLSVVMADLDNLKLVNDHHSHARGDDVLRYTARIARETCRQADMVGRYGGDEFVFVLPVTPLREAAAFGERFRETLASAPVANGLGESIQLTASLGVAQWDKDSMTSPTGLIDKADGAMYAAKSAGRNRTMVAEGNESRAA